VSVQDVGARASARKPEQTPDSPAALALVGDDVAEIYEEVKGRPLYVVGEALNLPRGTARPPRGVRLGEREPESNGTTNHPIEERSCQPFMTV
jgi:hypothetical protein